MSRTGMTEEGAGMTGEGAGMTRRGHCRHKGTSACYLDDTILFPAYR
ncbi:MAG: hypothetical protein O7157_01465 [Wolbachia endosymbiont of Tetragnatha montana]|nr:hypothetical protein [Wolbachia endosymbiont of Tetragnatha montana]